MVRIMNYIYNGETFEELCDGVVSCDYVNLIIPKYLLQIFDENIRIPYSELKLVVLKTKTGIKYESDFKLIEEMIKDNEAMFMGIKCITE